MTDGPRPRPGGSQRGPTPDPVRRPAPGVAALRDNHRTGYGSPEGKEFAGNAVTYQDTDPTGSGKVYRKSTPSGNTGWVELGGGGGGQQPYAIKLQRVGTGDFSVSASTLTPLNWTGSGHPVYFENNGGVAYPPVGSNNPPADGESMWSDAAPTVCFAPVGGLWGFAVEYQYDAVPLGTFVFTLVHMAGGPVASKIHGREAIGAGPLGITGELECTCSGTTLMSAGDWIKVWTYHEAAGAKYVKCSPGGVKTDEPQDGPVLSMWLIAPEGS